MNEEGSFSNARLFRGLRVSLTSSSCFLKNGHTWRSYQHTRARTRTGSRTAGIWRLWRDVGGWTTLQYHRADTPIITCQSRALSFPPLMRANTPPGHSDRCASRICSHSTLTNWTECGCAKSTFWQTGTWKTRTHLMRFPQCVSLSLSLFLSLSL